MTTTQGATNRRRGITAERALVRWLRANGWPQAERSVVTGYRTANRERRDGGDITGTELEAMDGHRDVRLLVVKRRGHADPGMWWCWLTLAELVGLFPADDDMADHITTHGLVRVQLNVVAPLLRAAGYGEAA